MSKLLTYIVVKESFWINDRLNSHVKKLKEAFIRHSLDVEVVSGIQFNDILTDKIPGSRVIIVSDGLVDIKDIFDSAPSCMRILMSPLPSRLLSITRNINSRGYEVFVINKKDTTNSDLNFDLPFNVDIGPDKHKVPSISGHESELTSIIVSNEIDKDQYIYGYLTDMKYRNQRPPTYNYIRSTLPPKTRTVFDYFSCFKQYPRTIKQLCDIYNETLRPHHLYKLDDFEDIIIELMLLGVIEIKGINQFGVIDSLKDKGDTLFSQTTIDLIHGIKFD